MQKTKENIKKRMDDLYKQPINVIKDIINRYHKIYDSSGSNKGMLISQILEDEFGNGFERILKSSIPSRKEIEELVDREKTLEEERKKEKETSWRERYFRDYSKKESKQKIKASIISAVEEIKWDLDKLQTNSIGFDDILKWIDRVGHFNHHISRADAEDVSNLLIQKYRIQIK